MLDGSWAFIQRNQFGFSLGGPVIRNRTFFFGGFEGLRQRVQQTRSATVPSPDQTAGDFSSTLNRAGKPITSHDPFSTRPNPDGSGSVREPVPNNAVPSARIDPVAARALALYSAPNIPAIGPARIINFIAAGSGASDDDNFDVRVDQRYTDTHTTFFRWSYRDSGRSAAWHHNWTIKPNLLSDISISYSDLFTRRQSHSFGTNINEALGLPRELGTLSNHGGLTTFVVPGFGALGESFLARFRLQSHGLQYKLSWVRGRHTLKFGHETRINRTHFFQGLGPAGQFNFSPAFTQGPDPTRGTPIAGNSVASMLSGMPASGFATHDEAISTHSPYLAWHVQDDFKVTPTLTVNFGLRYSLDWPRTERYNRLSVFNPVVPSPLTVPAYPDLKGGLEFAGVDRQAQFELDRNNLSPRFGFAWRALPETVLRGGYAIFFPPPAVTAAGTLGGGGVAGFSSSSSFVSSLDGGLTPNDTLSNPLPNGYTLPAGSSKGLLSFAGQNFQTNNIFDRSPYVQRWNLSTGICIYLHIPHML